jgi:glycolate oxidase FAD binding subunit
MSAAVASTPVPASVAELLEIVRSSPRVLAVGARTKPRLSSAAAVKVSTAALRGIVEYEPSEFTFTALAGTPVRDLADALAARGQYLPFDPMFCDAGATLGGTAAAGLSGPGRLRYGGLKDFILGTRFVDGAGRLLRLGGKVVKNAAGFDLPKFFVGSLGRLGVLVELTFKVFPARVSTLTLKIPAKDIEQARSIMVEAANSRWVPDAIDLLPNERSVCLRLAGPAPALAALAREILDRWPGETLSEEASETVWSGLREFAWAHANGPLIKVALTTTALLGFEQSLRSLEEARAHISAAGNLAFISLPNEKEVGVLSERLRQLSVPGVMLRGEGPLWCGAQARPQIAQAVKEALDPNGRFPGLDD